MLLRADLTKQPLEFETVYTFENMLYSSPSSVIFGAGPMFDNDTLLVTEKGIMFDLYTSMGNKLSGQHIE